MNHHSRPSFISTIVTFIIYTTIVILIVIISTLPTTASGQTSATSLIRDHQLRTVSNIRLTTNDVTQTSTRHTRSQIECLVVCLKTPSCVSLTFQPQTRLCHAHQVTLATPGVTVTYDPTFKYTEISSRVEWHLTFRATQGLGVSVYDMWMNTGHVDDVTSVTSDTIGCLTVDDALPCDKHLRTWRLDDWNHVARVKHAFYTDNQQVFYVTFDATGTTSANRDDHFRIANIVASSATELVGYTGNFNFDSIQGDQSVLRRFFLNVAYYGCHNDPGWMFVNDGFVAAGGCAYEMNGPFPNFFYTASNTAINWADAGVTKAKVFAVFIKYQD